MRSPTRETDAAGCFLGGKRQASVHLFLREALPVTHSLPVHHPFRLVMLSGEREDFCPQLKNDLHASPGDYHNINRNRIAFHVCVTHFIIQSREIPELMAKGSEP